MAECINVIEPFPCISVLKPWGGYTDIFRSDEVVFKKIVISPGEEISYQQHHKRSEFWYVTEGEGVFRYNNTYKDQKRLIVKPNLLSFYVFCLCMYWCI